ncbi:MAG: hypothetical protein J2P50_08915 [Hyphomicrobiaceae bacterium]|nr:hypothetical protein [Hyphomicrobiaceae bacterium]
MAHLVKALAGTRRAAVDLVAAALIFMGGFLIFGALIFRVFIRPEWTSGQALGALWPFLAVGTAILTLGWLVDRTAVPAAAVRNRPLEPDR